MVLMVLTANHINHDMVVLDHLTHTHHKPIGLYCPIGPSKTCWVTLYNKPVWPDWTFYLKKPNFFNARKCQLCQYQMFLTMQLNILVVLKHNRCSRIWFVHSLSSTELPALLDKCMDKSWDKPLFFYNSSCLELDFS